MCNASGKCVGGIKFGNTLLILPTTKFSSTPIFAAIYSDKWISHKIYKLHSYIAMQFVWENQTLKQLLIPGSVREVVSKFF